MTSLASISSSCLAASLAWLWQVQGVGDAMKQPAVQSALIAAAIGLIVFAGTQWVLHCRERTSLLLEKLELLYKSTSSLANLSAKRAEYYSAPQSREGLVKVKGTKLTDEISMLQAFHFPSLSTRITGIMNLNGKVLQLLGGKTRADSKEELRRTLDELNHSIAGTLGVICKDKDYLTRGKWYHYIPIVRSCS